MSIYKKIMSSVAPVWTLKREAARKSLNVLNSGYSNHGASRTKKSLLGWPSSGGSPNEDIIDNIDTLRERSRDLYMGGAALATGALKTMRTNVVGTALRLKPSIDAEFLGLSDDEARELKRNIEREFKLWSETVECDIHRMHNFGELQQLAFLSQLMSGDCFALLPMVPRKHSTYDLRVRILEADRCSNPSLLKGKQIKGGVEIDKNGEVVAYHFCNQHPLGRSNAGMKEWARVKAFGEKTGRRNVIHLMEAERPEQFRGVPILAPVIESLKQLGRYTEAELMAAVISGMFTVFIKSKSPNDSPIGQSISEDQRVDDEDENSYELGNGSVIALDPDEEIQEANPGRPNAAFDGFVTAILRQVGSALELPYELLIKHFSASYSASRAALLEAWKMFRMRRSWLASDFCHPIYVEWFSEAVAKGRIRAPGFFEDPLIRQAYTQAEWHGPSQGQIDPLKEAKAAQLRVGEGFSTRERETAELTGGDFEMNHRQRVREETLRRQDGLDSLEGGERESDMESDEDGKG